MIVVKESNCLSAWKAGSQKIITEDQFNLITVINDPCQTTEEWIKEYNPRKIKQTAATLSDVITTIFPYKIKHTSREGLYSHYHHLHKRKSQLGKKKKKAWGTYFSRMTSFGKSEINQLEKIIEVINNDSRHLRALNPIHISSSETDSLSKRLGNPCLQYIQLTYPEKQLFNMNVVYRSHDFFEKALGNFIGLGKLMEFIANETNHRPNNLVCHSMRAYNSGSSSQLRRLAKL